MADNSAWLAVVKARVQPRVLAPLTQESEETETSSTIDNAILQVAIDDAIGMFRLYARVIASVTNTVHIPVIITGTMFFLNEYKFPGQNRAMEDKFRYKCLDIAATLTNAPVTTNINTRSDPTRGGQRSVYADSDRSRFSGYLPDTETSREDW